MDTFFNDFINHIDHSESLWGDKVDEFLFKSVFFRDRLIASLPSYSNEELKLLETAVLGRLTLSDIGYSEQLRTNLYTRYKNAGKYVSKHEAETYSDLIEQYKSTSDPEKVAQVKKMLDETLHYEGRRLGKLPFYKTDCVTAEQLLDDKIQKFGVGPLLHEVITYWPPRSKVSPSLLLLVDETIELSQLSTKTDICRHLLGAIQEQWNIRKRKEKTAIDWFHDEKDYEKVIRLLHKLQIIKSDNSWVGLTITHSGRRDYGKKPSAIFALIDVLFVKGYLNATEVDPISHIRADFLKTFKKRVSDRMLRKPSVYHQQLTDRFMLIIPSREKI